MSGCGAPGAAPGSTRRWSGSPIPANYINDPALAWKRVKIQTRRPDALGRLKALAAWREIEARSKNLPRGRIMKDETLADVAMHPPASQEALAQVRGLSPAWRGNDIGARMMEALANADPMPASELPAREERGPGLGREGALVADLLKLLLKIRARESNVAPRLVARSEELELLAAGRREGLAILEGWRFEEFGRDALDLVEGRLAFAIRGGKLVMTRTELETEHEERIARRWPADGLHDGGSAKSARSGRARRRASWSGSARWSAGRGARRSAPRRSG